MPKISKAFVTWDEFWELWEGTWTPSTHTHVWADITDFSDYLDQAVKQASSPLFANLNLGASPSIRHLSGSLTFQTNEGVNTHTYIDIKGKGTGYGIVRIYDQDDEECLKLYAKDGTGRIETSGTAPGALFLQQLIDQDIYCWLSITGGNPYFYVYGWHVTDTDWMRMRVEADGDALIEAENKLNFRASGSEFNFGATPLIRQTSGALTFQTDEGVNTTTYLDIKGKGTTGGVLRIYDEDDNSWLQLQSLGAGGYLKLHGAGTSLNFQYDQAKDIKCYAGIGSGNPYFYIYGFKAADAVKYLRARVRSDGYSEIDPQERCYFSVAGTAVGHWISTGFNLRDDKLYSFGTGSDYSIGYHEPTDSLQIVDGATLNANVRIALLANGNVGIGTATPCDLLHVNNGVTSGMDAFGFFGITISDNISPSLFFEDTGEGVGDRVMGMYYASEKLVFSSLTDDGSAFDVNNILVLRRDGDVGIGKVPTCKLDVDGTIKATEFYVKLDDLLEPDDNIDLNVSIARHGLFPKLSNNYREFFSGTGQWYPLVSSSGIAIYVLSGVSTTVRNSNDALKSTASQSWVKLKETKLGEPCGKMKISFVLASDLGGLVYGRIRVNGATSGDWGTSTQTSTTTALTHSDDLGPFNAQDLIQVYAKCEMEEELAQVQDMRFKYDRAITYFGDWEVVTPIPTVLQTAFIVQNQDP